MCDITEKDRNGTRITQGAIAMETKEDSFRLEGYAGTDSTKIEMVLEPP